MKKVRELTRIFANEYGAASKRIHASAAFLRRDYLPYFLKDFLKQKPLFYARLCRS
jgi:hypothetical protein